MRITKTRVNHAEAAPDHRLLRVALICAQPLCREGFALALRTVRNMALVEGRCDADAITIAREKRADVILFDISSLPRENVNLPWTLARDHPETRIALLSESERVVDVVAALDGGLRGYVLKTIEGSELVSILKAIHDGEIYIPPQLAAQAILRRSRGPARSADGGASKFTRREQHILTHLSRGLANKEIARALQISEKTVKHHMTTIMAKLHVRNRVEAVLKLMAKP